VVWRVLADLAGWAAWNPLYIRAEGSLKIGTRLSLTQALEGRTPVIIQPTVVDWVPDAQILWRLSQNGGLIRRLRYIEIDKLSQEACILSNGEDWTGLLVRYVPVELRRALRAGYAAMGEAIRDEAVRLWHAEGGAPTSDPT